MSEKGFTKDPNDKGNWTGGRVGVGELKGTNMGVSAASYPHFDIENLTVDQIKKIYLSIWFMLRLNEIDKYCNVLSELLFDLAINCGNGNAGRFLQRAINTVVDVEDVALSPRRASKWRMAIAKQLNLKILAVDGSIGPITVATLGDIPYPYSIVGAVIGEAYKHYSKLSPY